MLPERRVAHSATASASHLIRCRALPRPHRSRPRWQVAKLEPTNRDAREGLVAVQKLLAEYKLKEKSLFGHMFVNKTAFKAA